MTHLAISLQSCESVDTAAFLNVCRTDGDGGKADSGLGIFRDFFPLPVSGSSSCKSKTASTAKNNSIITIFLQQQMLSLQINFIDSIDLYHGDDCLNSSSTGSSSIFIWRSRFDRFLISLTPIWHNFRRLPNFFLCYIQENYVDKKEMTQLRKLEHDKCKTEAGAGLIWCFNFGLFNHHLHYLI